MTRFNAAFARWFGDSKVVDRNGEPRVVYHGTAAEPFSAFKLDWPIYFNSNMSVAMGYASGYLGERALSMLRRKKGARVIAAYLRMERPADLTDPEVRSELAANGYVLDLNEPEQVAEAMSDLEDMGFDGIIAEHQMNEGRYDGTLEFVVFRPGQVKSIYNRGTWDPGDPNIRRNPR